MEINTYLCTVKTFERLKMGAAGAQFLCPPNKRNTNGHNRVGKWKHPQGNSSNVPDSA